MGKADRDKKKYSDEQMVMLIRAELSATLVIFLTAKSLQDQEFQNILGTVAGRLVKAGLDVNLVDTVLDNYASQVQSVQAALIEAQEDSSCSKLKN